MPSTCQSSSLALAPKTLDQTADYHPFFVLLFFISSCACHLLNVGSWSTTSLTRPMPRWSPSRRVTLISVSLALCFALLPLEDLELTFSHFIGANPSAEEAEEGAEDGSVTVNNIAHSFRLQTTSFDKKVSSGYTCASTHLFQAC